MFSNEKLRSMILPLFVDQLLLILVTFLSSLMIAQAGENALSGVSLVDMINSFLFYIFISLASGGSVVISQYMGNKNKTFAQMSAAQIIGMNSLISLVISIVLFIFHQPIITLLFSKADPLIVSTASTYFFLSILSYPFYSLYQSGNAIFRSIGNTKVPMLSSIMMNFLNFFGNALSIYVFHVGVLGFGLSAIIARVIASLFVFFVATSGATGFQVFIHQIFQFKKEIIQRILKIAIPSSIEDGVLNGSKIILASLIASFGTAHIAANGVANSLVTIGISYALASNLVMVSVVGQCVGANDYDQARYYIKKIIKWMYVMNAILMILQTVFTPFLIQLYHLSSETASITFNLVLIHNVFALFMWPLSFTIPNALRSAGDSRFTMMNSIFAVLVFRVGFTLILSLHFGLGIYGIWISMIIDWLVRASLNIVRYRSNKWTQFRLI